jgi:O-antigen/teichoic acid export membrane protein
MISLYRNSMYIMAALICDTALGYGFWAIVARTATGSSASDSSLVISVMSATAHLTTAGIGLALVVLLTGEPAEPRWSATVIRYALIAAAIAGAGAAAILALPAASDRFAVLWQPCIAAGLLVGTPVYAVAAMTDYAFVSLRRSDGMLWRNIAFSAMKIGALLICASAGVVGVVAVTGTWTAAAALSIAIAAAQLHRWKPDARPRLRRTQLPLRPAISVAARQHASTLGGTITPLVVPVLIAAHARPGTYAHFFVPWTAGEAIFIIPTAIATSTLAEVTGDPARTRGLVRRAVSLSAALSTAFLALTILLGPQLLAAFGRSYVTAGSGLLTVMAASAIPGSITSVAVAVWRATDRALTATAFEFGVAMSVCALVAVLAPRAGFISAGIALGVVRTTAAATVTVACAWAAVRHRHGEQSGDGAERDKG